MAKIEWDKKTGGVILKRHYSSETLSVSPRPVFFEELDLLQMDKHGWKYPKGSAPLLWACNKQYYYRGDFVLETKGANVYDAPTVIVQPGFEKLMEIPKESDPLLLLRT